MPVTLTGSLSSSAAWISSDADLTTWTTGMTALPVMPAVKVSWSSPKIDADRAGSHSVRRRGRQNRSA